MIFADLRAIPLFKGLSDTALADLAAAIPERTLPPGEMLFRQGDAGYECYVILAGALEVITYLNGAELQLEVRHAGQIIGEMALIDHSPRSATVRAVSACHLAVLNEQHFTLLMRSDPELAVSMLRDGTARLRTTSQRMISDLETKNAELARAYQELQAAQSELIRLNRLEEELAVARRIQESFLPRSLPQPAGWQIAGFSRGAQAVGGDFFDCIALPGERLGLIVADVCGKGVTAALFVALARSLLRAASQAPGVFQGSHALSAEAILSGATWLTNDYITREHADSDMFITLFYAVLEPHSGQLSYINAGHNPPLVLSATGNVRELESTTLPIGIMPGQTFEVVQTQLAPNDTLIAFSDGITEAMNDAGAIFGDERLLAFLRSYATQAPATLLAGLVQTVDAFVATAPQADDMTLLILQRNGGGDPGA